MFFTDGDGLFLRRGEKKKDKREVVWMDKTVRVTEDKPTPQQKQVKQTPPKQENEDSVAK